MMKTNIYAPFWIIKAALPHMKPGAVIIGATSEQAYDPSPDLYDYTQTAALLIRLLAAALATSVYAQPPPVSPDDFVAAASSSAQYQIMAARLAPVESRDPEIRAFATEMNRDHSMATTAIQQAALRSGLQPPPPTSAAIKCNCSARCKASTALNLTMS